MAARRTALAGLALGLCGAALAATRDAAERTVFAHLGSEQGLSQNTIRCMFQDRQGFMWLGTQDGLNRYDGYSFRVYRQDAQNPQSLPNNSVSSILEDSEGVLWVGTSGGGLGVLDRRTERFSTFQHDGDPGSIGDNLVTFLYEDRERRLWIGTESGGLNRFDRQTRRFVHYRHDAGDPRSIAADDVQAMVQDRDGILWFGTRLAGLDRFDPRTGGFRHFRHSGRDPDSLGDDTVLSLCADATGRLWIGTAKGIEALDRSTFRFSRPQRSPQIGNQVYAIHASGTGDVWMGTQHGLEKLTKDFTVMDYEHDALNPSSPSSGAVHSILEDRSGVYWFGTDKGADRFSPYSQRFATWGVASAPFRASGNTEAWSFLVDAKGILWIATQNGLGRYDRATGDFKRFAPSAGGSGEPNSLYSIAGDGQRGIWAGTRGGLSYFDRTTERFHTWRHDASQAASLADDIVFCVYVDRTGALWAGTQGGLDKLNPANGGFTHYRHGRENPDSPGGNDIRAIAEDAAGNIWIGTRHDGLDRLDPATGKFQHFTHNPARPDSLSGNAVYAVLCSRDGAVWAGTTQGLNRLDPKTGLCRRFTGKDGLPNDTVYALLEDPGGDLWISTDRGLSRMNTAKGTFRNYSASDGLQGNEFDGGAAYRSAAGEMFFGGINGFSSFYPGQVRDSSFEPPMAITAFRKLDRQVPGISEARSVQVSYRENVFSVEFAALDYTAPEKCKYVYKLEGFDRDWRESGATRAASYTNLDGGHYLFRVRGTNSDGVWSSHEASLEIEVLPPPWKRPWFMVLAAMLTLGALAWAYRARMAQLRRARVAQETFSRRLIESQEAERKRIAAELHDSLGQNLVVIKNSALLGLKDGGGSQKRFDEISSTASLALEEVRQIAHDLRPYQLDRLGLTRALRSLVNQANDSSPVAFTAEIDPVDDIFSRKEDQINLYRVVQESVTNILKHSAAAEARLTVTREAKSVTVRVEDNGRGFDAESPDRASDGFGVSGMAERARILGARYAIRSAPGKGTAILLEIPVREEQA